MLRQYCYQPDFDKVHPEIDPAATAPASWRLAAMLQAIPDAWREALAAQRQYERLRSRGIAHDPALKEALGVRMPARDFDTAKAQVATPSRSHARPGTVQNREANSRCARGLTDPVAPPPRLRDAAHIGNLTYVS